jgi:glutamate racemase
MSAERPPIGIFDSGVGGLSVAREIHALLPDERLVYVADTAWCPYGDRDVDVVRTRALAVGRHLQEAGAKVLVTACNTASGAALEELRAALDIPVIGLEPAVKTGVAVTRNGRVGVMATSGTLRSERFARLVRDHAQHVTVVQQPCPGLVDLIEGGHLDDAPLGELLARLAAPLQGAGVDTVVLGCTHYPFVHEPLARALGPDVRLVDSGSAVARRTAAVLQERSLAASRNGAKLALELRTTGDPATLEAVVRRLWAAPVRLEAVTI